MINAREIAQSTIDVHAAQSGVKELLKLVRQIVEDEVFRIAMMPEDLHREGVMRGQDDGDRLCGLAEHTVGGVQVACADHIPQTGGEKCG
ncbi:MAG: hypothetical protein LW645_02490 [Verrucomicrobiaceae bacterium]|nr:hypothetical protein [Verrucomicrobiaceae bacterium]